MMKRKEIIRLENVSFSYTNEPFLKDISLSIYENDFVGVVGPNGGGKTTLLKLLLGFLKPQTGTVHIYGKSPEQMRNRIGYLSQFRDIDFDFPITAYEIVLLSIVRKSLFTHYTDSDHKKVKKIMDELGVWEHRDKKLNQLSGGQKQRVFVARALVHNPDILILDEPLSNMDIHIQEEFYSLLRSLNKKRVIIIVEHDLELISSYAKEIVCINKCKAHSITYHPSDKKQIKEACNA